MTVHLHQVPLENALLQRMADDLLAQTTDEDLANCLVLLPSSRACRTLEHLLFESSPGSAMLLPRIQTLTQWIAGLAIGLGISLDDLPDERVRPLALAPLLAAQPWLKEHPESAAGLAREFIALFDQARLEDCGDVLFDAAGSDNLGELLGSGPEAETTGRDLERVRLVWQLYRKVVARDRTDALMELAARWSDDGPDHIVDIPRILVGGFGRLTRIHAQLLYAAMQTGQEVDFFLPRPSSVLDHALCATWAEAPLTGGTDPFSATARLFELMRTVGCFEDVEAPVHPHAQFDSQSTLNERLNVVWAAGEPVNPDGRITLMPCPDPETESRRVVDLVVLHLDQCEGPPEPIAIATADPLLAARILALLQEAGIEADNTLGSPLGSLPAGLLARFILRAALTDLRAEPLLEVLTHPFVSLPVKQDHHPLWTLRLERMFRRASGPQSGLAGLSRRAVERDQVVRDLFGRDDPGMAAFVGEVATAFAPLMDRKLQNGAPWSDHVAALRSSWQLLTDQRPAPDQGPRQDEQALARLWEILAKDTAGLPAVTLGEFSTAVSRLLAEEMVVPHRPRNLPVLVTGMVEARLEKYDHLILAGLRDGVFPSQPPRQVLLTPRLTGKLGLPGWREHLGLDAELFLRLLHNAGRITVTWPLEDVGKQFLPSPLVSRLILALNHEPEKSMPSTEAVPQWRKGESAGPEIMAAQKRFQAEVEPVTAITEARAQLQLSWSALRMWQECPYRFLMERRFALTREDELRQEFSRMDFGSLVHGVLEDFLTAGSPGRAALENGNESAALVALDADAVARFSPGAEDLPVRRLWLDSFRRAMPAIVRVELERLKTWRPLLLEQKFILPLSELVGWTKTLCGDLGLDQDQCPDLGWDQAAELGAPVVLRGMLDRLDEHRERPGTVAVLDYKTGKLPTPKKVQELEELQVVLYAAAVEAGVVAHGLQDVRVAEGAYYQIGEDRSGPPAKPHLPGATPEGRALLAAGSLRLIDLALEAADPLAKYPLLSKAGKDGSKAALPCKYCDLRGVCRLEEMKGAMSAELWLGLSRIIHQREGSF